MATNNRGGNRGGSNRGGSNRGRNNNPEGHNQYSGMMGSARENPLAAAAAIGGAVAAGVFLWSRRNQISDQLSNISDQIGDWADGLSSSSDFLGDSSGSGQGFMAQSSSSSSSPSRRGGRTQSQVAEEALTLKETGKTA